MKSAFKFIILVLAIGSAALLFQNCAGGGDSGGSVPNIQSAAITGLDFSGVWSQAGVACYNASLTSATSTATFTGGNTDLVTISGNSFTEISSEGGCTINNSGNLVFQSTTMSITNSHVSNATNGSCTIHDSLSNSNITPTQSSTTYSTGQSLPNINNVIYFYNPSLATKAVGLLTNFSDGHGGYCFLIYYKQ